VPFLGKLRGTEIVCAVLEIGAGILTVPIEEEFI
jgi:hypothetical protein